MGTKNKDRLIGGLGNDKLFGKLGKDVMIGGAGKDVFVFDTKPDARKNVDWVADFNVADDTIWLDNKYFKIGKGTFSKPVKLNKKMFWTGTKAHDADDRIIYNKKTGALLYDEDGTGDKAAIKIATLSSKLKLSNLDFFAV